MIPRLSDIIQAVCVFVIFVLFVGHGLGIFPTIETVAQGAAYVAGGSAVINTGLWMFGLIWRAHRQVPNKEHGGSTGPGGADRGPPLT